MHRIIVIPVPVSDQEAAKRFYTEQLGLQLLADLPPMDGTGRWVQVSTPGDDTSLSLVPSSGETPAGSLRGLVFATDDVVAEYRELTARGVSFLGPPAPAPGGIFATCVDPDGNQLRLRQTRPR